MRSYYLRFGGGLESLVLREAEEPHCGKDDVVVAVRAVSLNFRELMILQGRYSLPVRPELIPVADGAGEVIEAGAGVSHLKPGDRVMISVFPKWHGGPFCLEHADQIGGSLDGTLTERIAVSAQACLIIPDHLSYREAATLPCAALTAWNALTGGTPLRAGDTVVTMGTGGVSLFAVQFAKLFGARVLATTSGTAKMELLQKLGADVAINYAQTPAWSDVVRDLTGGRGCDLIVEVGGPGTLSQSMRCVALDGSVALVGGLAPAPESLDPAVFGSVYTMRRVAVGSTAQFAEMNRAIAFHRLRPVIDRVFTFDDAKSAFAYYAQRTSPGKVVIELNGVNRPLP